MNWFWQSREAPRDLPQRLYTCLVQNFGAKVDNLARLKFVERIGFEGEIPVTLIRIFDPEVAGKIAKIRNFVSLDRHPELIIYEGTFEKESGRLKIIKGVGRHR